MRKTFKNGLPCYQFHLIEGFSEQIDHAVFTRVGGVSDVPYDSLNIHHEGGDDIEAVSSNRCKILEAMRLDLSISMRQTHSKKVAIVDQDFVEKYAFSKTKPLNEVDDLDGMVTNLTEVGLIVKVADCQAILFFDPVNKVLGVAHAGWRGLVKDINGEIIGIMQERFGSHPQNILVGISPSLGPENAYFNDPFSELPPNFHPYIFEGKRVDLWKFCQNQLEGYGILPEKIECSRICTMSEGGKKFYSYRRDKGVTGRFALVAYLK